MKKKRALTLLEIMIVILIIGVIGSVIGYNMRGSLDEAKAFKTREGAKKIRDILTLQMATVDQYTPDIVQENISSVLESSNLVPNVEKLLKDGWGRKYEIVVKESGDIKFHSDAYRRYCKKKGISEEL